MQTYTHIGVYGILVRDHQVLLVQKARGPHIHKWDFPGGSIEFGEEPYETLKREFAEETGLTDIAGIIRKASSYTLIYPSRETELEHLHHIGIIYDVEASSGLEKLRSDGDGQDSLGARWIRLEELGRMEVTPFVQEWISSRMKQG
ncbi:NUDIX domain-containing protein [Paenibacillus sp. H1-7]|uniref:NUDIX hydrolase n=1 Tax=Paenibacillus sp. H1-7 TaxID=2282849 RepID=UPI001EF99EBE|nr:NUDIX hydrolase [Paenibacillus sp. H1-7]ULL17780.1 NUDIX domain-containing protein [Paenibacillus sp. H1-7]